MRRNASGFTLIEVLIASVLMAGVIAMVYSVLFSSAKTYEIQSVMLNLDQRARQMVNDIAKELREAGGAITTGSPAVPVASGTTCNDLRFGIHSGFDMATRQVRFTDVVRYRWVLGPGEVQDGADNNGNGRADEGYVEKTWPDGTVSKVCWDVAFQGLKFVCNSRNVTITLEMESRDHLNRIIRRTAETTVELRN